MQHGKRIGQALHAQADGPVLEVGPLHFRNQIQIAVNDAVHVVHGLFGDVLQ